MLGHWIGWAIIVILFATTYVQIVGKHIELASGLDRLESLQAYRYFFGGAPWVQWPMFRWSGFIQIASLIAILALPGWKALFLMIGAWVFFMVIVWRPARGHALEMVNNLQKAIDDKG